MLGLMPWRKERAVAPRPEEAFPFRLMRRDLDTLLHRFFDRWPLDLPEMDYPVWGLKVEELDKELVVHAEAPGFEAKDIEVNLTGDLLTIAAMKKEEGKTEPVAELKRYVTVPPDIDPAKVEALYRNGVLEVHLPKPPEAVGRRIEVKV